MLGNLFGHGLNLNGRINHVQYFDGATVIDAGIENGAFAVGNNIFGPRGFRPDFRDHLFVHEYGHYLQSQVWGPLYIPLVGIPSVQSAAFWPEKHENRWFEAEASRKANTYFDDRYGAGRTGYARGSADFFDSESYINGTRSPYINTRNGGRNNGPGAANPIYGSFDWTDPLLYIYFFFL